MELHEEIIRDKLDEIAKKLVEAERDAMAARHGTAFAMAKNTEQRKLEIQRDVLMEILDAAIEVGRVTGSSDVET